MIEKITPKVICDKCGRKEDAAPDYNYMTNYIGTGIATPQFTHPSSWLKLFNRDYCDNCKKEIEKLINNYEKDNNN